MLDSSESWEPQQRPLPWRSRAGGGAVHSIRRRHRETLAALSSLCEVVLDRSFESQQFLHTGPLHHALKMRRTVLEARQVELELPSPPLTPEEVRVGCGEVVEEELSSG